jgi:hypothetical protein
MQRRRPPQRAGVRARQAGGPRRGATCAHDMHPGALLLVLLLLVLASSASAVVHPPWDWEPDFSNTVQHCLPVRTVNGSWPHMVRNASRWVEINESIAWVNNSRLLTLAVPAGTPPKGGWPVLIDLLIQDYPTRTPGFKGLDFASTRTCGLDGDNLPDPAAAHTSPQATPACLSALADLCGAVQNNFTGCLECTMYSRSNKAALRAAGCPPGGQMNRIIFGKCGAGKSNCHGWCPTVPPISQECNRSIDLVCGWTRKLARTDYRSYEINCSHCVAEHFHPYLPNISQTGCPIAPTWNASGPASVQMQRGYCSVPYGGGGAHNAGRGAHNDPVRLFWPFASPQRFAMGCSCVNSSKFECGKPFDDGHLGQDFVPPGEYCDSDIFFGGLWHQRLKQSLLSNGIAVLEANQYLRDAWNAWPEIWDGGFDAPFFAAFRNAIIDGTQVAAASATGGGGGDGGHDEVPIPGRARSMLMSLDPQKLIFRGWSGSSHMVSWLIQAHATQQLPPGLTIAAGLMFSGGSYQCYNSPPFSKGVCKSCNATIEYQKDPRALGCSDTYKQRGLSEPYCQLCCPRNTTEAWYDDDPARYKDHPWTFLAQSHFDMCGKSTLTH